MQHHALQISRKIEYGLRAMVCLAAQPAGTVVPFREIARRMDVPEAGCSREWKKTQTGVGREASRPAYRRFRRDFLNRIAAFPAKAFKS